MHKTYKEAIDWYKSIYGGYDWDTGNCLDIAREIGLYLEDKGIYTVVTIVGWDGFKCPYGWTYHALLNIDGDLYDPCVDIEDLDYIGFDYIKTELTLEESEDYWDSTYQNEIRRKQTEDLVDKHRHYIL